MSRFAAGATLAAIACLLTTAGCSQQSCGGGKCPQATFDLRTLPDSSVTWTFGNANPRTSGVVPYPPSGTDCSLNFTRGTIIGRGDAAPETLLQGHSTLWCNGGELSPFDLVFSDLGDFRDWSVGSFTIAATRRNFGLDGGGGSCPVAYFAGMAMTVTVETATGGPAPYPKLVTDDFERTFRFTFDTSSVPATTSDGVPCQSGLAAQVSLHLAQTAADYVYDPNAACHCE